MPELDGISVRVETPSSIDAGASGGGLSVIVGCAQSVNVSVATGVPGPAGDHGETGAQGPQGPPGNVVLASPLVFLTATGSATLYTAGEAEVVVGVEVVLALDAAINLTVAPVVRVETSSGQIVHSSQTLTGLNAAGEQWIFARSGLRHRVAFGESLVFVVETAAVADLLQARAYVLGAVA